MTEASEWRGRVGDAWAEEWRRTDRTIGPIGEALVAAVRARVGRASPRDILDIGCGAGSTSLALAGAFPGARIAGIDLSEALVAAARARAEGMPQLAFEVGDAGVWRPADGRRFDLLVSRHGVMFFDDPVAAFAHLRRLAAPDARLIFSCFRARAENEWAAALLPLIERFAPDMLAGPPPPVGPFAFADPARIEAILSQAGFAAPEITPFDCDFVAGEGDDPVADAVGFFRRIGPFAALLKTLDAERSAEAADALADILERYRDGDTVRARAAAWIVSA